MTKEWYKLKGLRKNPLHVEPEFNEPLFGHDLLLSELFYRIDSGSIVFLEGDIGKTSILLKIIEKYKGNGKVAYVNCEKVKDEPDIKVILANGKKHIGIKMKGLPKGMILLLDNIQHLSHLNSEKIKYYFDHGNLQSVIMAGESFADADIPESMKHRIGSRVFKIRNLTTDEQVDIVLERLGFPEYFDERHIYKIAEKTSNIKELLSECNSALFVMANESMENIDDNIIEKLQHRKKDEQQSNMV